LNYNQILSIYINHRNLNLYLNFKNVPGNEYAKYG